jgi:hypothetical protein
MFPTDKGSRYLLPLIETDRQEILGLETELSASPVDVDEFPAISPTMHQPADLPPVEDGADGEQATMPIKGPALPLAASRGLEALGGEAEGLHHIPMSLAHELFAAKLPTIPLSEVGDISDRHQAARGGQPEAGAHDRGVPSSDVSDGSCASGVGHSIRVIQIAEVDQQASIIIDGYVGEVVARLHIDQDLMMDQDVDISFTIDGDGHFAVLLDQDMRIDQETGIDVEIYDDDGILYVDVFLHDSIEVEQDTAIDLRISDGPPGGTVEVNQDIVLDQDVSIDIDIEDELEERYVIRLDVDVLQDVDAAQAAIADITDRNGEIDMDVEAMQTATVDQEIMVRADFALA